MMNEMQTTAERLSLAAIGALAGLAVWSMIEFLPDMVDNARWLLALLTFGFAFFGVLMALLGPQKPVSAALGAAALALPAAVLVVWASLRFEPLDAFFENASAFAALGGGLFIAVPFLAAGMAEPGGWRDYARLFDTAWNIVVRYTAAWLFAGAAWGVALLSDALLGLVGVHVIEWLIDIEVVPFIFTGLVLGLGLAIVHELSDYVSPFLLIQLLRVMLPVLLIVVAVFIVALPFRGLSELFGQLSAAGTMTAVVFASVTLITTAIQRDNELSVEGRGMLWATQALCVLIAVPAALALYAVWLRVDQYGLTPARVAALLGTVVALIYAVSFAASIVLGGDWRARIRTVNRWKAMGVVALAALWLTPVINAERLSTASQVARVEAGVASDGAAFWEMAREWGKPGTRGLERLAAFAQETGDDTLAARIESARSAGSEWAYRSEQNSVEIGPLEGVVPLRPEGAALAAGAFDALAPREREDIHEACARRMPDGQPGCAMVIALFDPLSASQGAIGLYHRGGDNVQVIAYRLTDGVLSRTGRAVTGQGAPALLGLMDLERVLAGDFAIVPAARNVLDLGDVQIFPQN